MAVTHATATRNVIADAVVDSVDVGGAGSIVIRASTTDLVSIALAATGFGAAASGTAAVASTPRSGNAVATGTADNYQCKNGSGTVIFSGSVTATGGGGDLTLDTTSIAAIGQLVRITGGGYTAPA